MGTALESPPCRFDGDRCPPRVSHEFTDEHDPPAGHLLAIVTATVDEQGYWINMLANRDPALAAPRAHRHVRAPLVEDRIQVPAEGIC